MATIRALRIVLKSLVKVKNENIYTSYEIFLQNTALPQIPAVWLVHVICEAVKVISSGYEHTFRTNKPFRMGEERC
ncbi:hypothetical protein D3C73_1359100 [compost metagenome]